ncbi:DUF6402 family protein [Snodgrassella alvi]|uniref:DUF6402 family protein n=1 Tax=Snodgrassella TaxID=1193515 RepID=UPI0018DEAB22|nr:DUF6402 family protein [Snodgrassella sp. W8132]MBI0133656.1 hypothetical protein [Snodgrassella sp. W8132]
MAELKTHTMKSAPKTTLNADIFTIDQIPAAMDKMGWKVAPQLMRHWFSGKPAKAFTEKEKHLYVRGPAINIPSKHVNDSIVKMQWARQFKPVQKGLNILLNNWASYKGKKELINQLAKSNGILTNRRDIREIDTFNSVNSTTIGDYLKGFGETIDDYFGAIGKANLKLAVQGYQDRSGGKNVFITKQIGFYIKDTYDFLGNEFLGVWHKDGVLNKKQMLLYVGYQGSQDWVSIANMNMQWAAQVYNSDFRRWQQVRNTGVDFMVFSDVLWLPPLENHRRIDLNIKE